MARCFDEILYIEEFDYFPCGEHRSDCGAVAREEVYTGADRIKLENSSCLGFLMENASDFILKEYEALRREMEEAVKETRVLERSAVLATGAIWSWLVGAGKPEYELAKWLPALIVLALGIRALLLTSHIDFLAKYFIEVEKSFLLPSGLGFEQQFKRKGKAKRLSAYVFWAVLFVVVVVLPFVVPLFK
jgi:hypothetical protein